MLHCPLWVGMFETTLRVELLQVLVDENPFCTSGLYLTGRGQREGKKQESNSGPVVKPPLTAAMKPSPCVGCHLFH